MANEVTIKVKADTAQATSAISALNKSWVGLNAGLSLAKQAAQTLGDAYNFLAGDTMKYAAQVRQMMRVSGQSAEMTSRMIQLTDDFALSEGSLEAAMRGASMKGIAFTVDNLAKLSDEYLKLAPGTERNTFLIQSFGRAGLEMAKVMERGSEAIKEQGAAQADNLIMTQANLDAAEELRIAEDNLNDSFQGLKYTIGNAVIPVLVDAADAFQELITWEQRLNDVLEKHNKDIVNSGMSYADYTKEVERTNAAAKKGMSITQAFGAAFSFSQKQADQFIPSIRMMSEAEYANAAAAAEADARLMQWGNTLRTTANVDVPNTTRAIDAMGERYQAQANMIIEANQKAADSIRNDIAKAMGEAQAAAEEWIAGAGGDVAGELDKADLSAGQYNQALIALDGAMGTNTYQAKLQGDAVKKIVDEFKKTGDVDAFSNSLQRMKNGGFIPLIDSIKNAQLELDILYSKLKLIDGTFRATVVVDLPGGGGTPTPTPSNDSGNVPIWIPPINNNMADGFSVAPTSNSTAGGGVSIGVLNLTLPSVTNAAQFAAELGRMANNALNSGRAYQGG